MDINQILSSTAVGTIGSVISVLIGVVGIYLWLISRHEKAPCWAIRTNNLIVGTRSKLPGIEVTYEGQQVENISVSKIVFWNDGRDTINRFDIVSSSPLKIIGENGAVLLDASVQRANSPSNSFSVSRAAGENACLLDFEYLDKGQGAIIQIVHTGTSSKDLKVIGAIKGVKVLRLKQFETERKAEPVVKIAGLSRTVQLRLFALLTIALISLFTYLAIWVSLPLEVAPTPPPASPPLTPASRAVLMGGLGALIVFIFIDRLRTLRSLPPGLEEFVETV